MCLYGAQTAAIGLQMELARGKNNGGWTPLSTIPKNIIICRINRRTSILDKIRNVRSAHQAEATQLWMWKKISAISVREKHKIDFLSTFLV